MARRPAPLQQPLVAQADLLSVSHDHIIVEQDRQRDGRLLDLARHLDGLTRWCRVTARAVLLATALCAFGAPEALAWGTHGHRVVAIIADRHLTAAARAETDRLMHTEGYVSLGDLATWADDWRHDHRGTGPWHFVNIPLGSAGFDMARDCGQGNCVVAKIAEFGAILADTSRPDADREVALKFLVHLVADIHQPLHCEDHEDRGGNDVPVSFSGFVTNLHHIWDTELVLAAGGQDPAALALQIDNEGVASEGGAPADWANDSHLAAQDAYRLLDEARGADLSGSYSAAEAPVVRARLAAAGLRLAALLNAALR